MGIGYLDYGARMYMPEIGRMGSVDRFAGKYASVSTYQFALGNPVINIDVNGDSAWKISKEWNESFIAKFNKSLPEYIQKYTARNDKYTCDDLALSLVMEFSKDNGLPFQWKTEAKNFDAASNEYNDYESFHMTSRRRRVHRIFRMMRTQQPVLLRMRIVERFCSMSELATVERIMFR